MSKNHRNNRKIWRGRKTVDIIANNATFAIISGISISDRLVYHSNLTEILKITNVAYMNAPW